MHADKTVSDGSDLMPEAKALFLCVLGTRLTVFSRELLLDPGPPEIDSRRSSGFVEMFHKIFGQLGHILDQSEPGYPDEVFEAALNAIATEFDIALQFRAAWNSALDFVKAGSMIS